MPADSWYDVNKTFLRGVVARDFAEPLPSFDASTPAATAQAALRARDFPVAGVREHGFVTGYVTREQLDDGLCGDYAMAFDDGAILADTAPVAQVIHALNEHSLVFVRILGGVGGVVRKEDLQDPPVRMWLFGLLTSLEQRFVMLIVQRYADESWQRYVSPARILKARELMDERARRGMDTSLLSCLQFADKAQIMVRDEVLRNQAGFASRKRAEEVIKGLERLRNNLAHAQEIVVSDWEMIVRIAENLDSVLERRLV